MAKYTVKKKILTKDKFSKLFNPEAIKFLLGDDIKDLELDVEKGTISFVHPRGMKIIMSKCEFKDFIIQLLSEYHKTKFKLVYFDGKYVFQYKVGDQLIKGKAETTEELLIVLQEIISDLKIYQ